MSTLWTIGYYEIDICPDFGTQLCGYGFNSSRRGNKVHDPLMARFVYWKGCKGEAMLVECDLLSMSTCYADELRAI